MDRRSDIDGLRALAVWLVLLFHAGLNDLRGGFIGVDVFFVISGYLIIPMIVTAQAESRFAFGAFLLRRLRRLLPAMVPVLIYALIAATLLLGEVRFQDFLASLIGAALYVSNHVFFAQAGYFDTASHEKLLMHTWSLAVEFQFYLLTPLLLWFARGRKAASALLVLLSVASFGLSEAWRGGEASAAFYLMAPRFWEFALGGLVALWVPLRAGNAGLSTGMRAAGLALILWAAIAYDARTAFPGVGALPPVLGTMLVLAAPHAPRDPLLWVLSCKAARWMGLRSYSIYLWHWPLMVTAVLASEWASEGLLLGMALLSVVLAAVSYPLIERPPQVNPKWRAPRRMLGLLALVPLLAALAFALPASWRVGLPLGEYRRVLDLVDHELALYEPTIHSAPESPARGVQCSVDHVATASRTVAGAALADCLAAITTPETVLVIGDSHGRETFHALRAAFPERQFALLHESNCPPVDYETQPGVWCFAGLAEGLKRAGLRPGGTVVLSSRWPRDGVERMGETAEVLRGLGQNAILVGMGPYLRIPMPNLLRVGRARADAAGDLRLPLEGLKFRQDSVATEAALASLAEKEGWLFVPKYPEFCNESGCLVEIPGQPGALLLLDGQHMTVAGMRWYAGRLAANPAIAALLAP